MATAHRRHAKSSKGTHFPAIDKSQQLTLKKVKNSIFRKNNQNTLLPEPNNTVAIKSPQLFVAEDLIMKCNLFSFPPFPPASK